MRIAGAGWRSNIGRATFFLVFSLLRTEGGTAASPVVRIPDFDTRSPGAKWSDRPSGRMVFEKGPGGVPGYRLVIPEKLELKGRGGAATSSSTLPLKPNRNYLLSVMVNSDFARPAEVNVGLQQIDGGGRVVMRRVRGLPNQTAGWQRWEWKLTSDPAAAHARFALTWYSFPKQGVLRIGDVTLLELPEEPLQPYARGDGATFRGGPGNLPMRIEKVQEEGDIWRLQTTGALYTIDRKRSTISARQLLERQRELVIWTSSIPLQGLRILRRNTKEVVLVNDGITLGLQVDGLLMLIPHNQLTLTCTSRIGGVWNRFAQGHLFVRDEFGGFTANPVIPKGTGRQARADAGTRPGRMASDEIDFAGRFDDNVFLSQVKPGWSIKWHLSPGERIAVSVFPPRPFPWKQSFGKTYASSRTNTPLESLAELAPYVDGLVLWDFMNKSWGMSFARQYVPKDDALLRRHVAAVKAAGMRPIVYTSPWFYYSRDVEEFTGELKRLRDTYGLQGAYFDGLPVDDWVVAYEEMRVARELYPDGFIILHHTFCPPLFEGSVELPAISTYADITYMAEGFRGHGPDWIYPKWMVTQFRKAATLGLIKPNEWTGVTPLEAELIMLGYNGRARVPTAEPEFTAYREVYYPILKELEKTWVAHGSDPEFYEKYYLPRYRELTAPLLRRK